MNVTLSGQRAFMPQTEAMFDSAWQHPLASGRACSLRRRKNKEHDVLGSTPRRPAGSSSLKVRFGTAYLGATLYLSPQSPPGHNTPATKRKTCPDEDHGVPGGGARLTLFGAPAGRITTPLTLATTAKRLASNTFMTKTKPADFLFADFALATQRLPHPPSCLRAAQGPLPAAVASSGGALEKHRVPYVRARLPEDTKVGPGARCSSSSGRRLMAVGRRPTGDRRFRPVAPSARVSSGRSSQRGK